MKIDLNALGFSEADRAWEREQFERFVRVAVEHDRPGVDVALLLHRDEVLGTYANSHIRCRWEGWMARACQDKYAARAVTAPRASPPRAEPRGQ